MKNKKSYYAWLIVFGCVIMMFTMWGMGYHPLSLYVVPITTAYGFSRTSFSMIFSIVNLCTAFGSMAYGFLSKKLGLKRLMLLGSGFCVVAYLLLSSARGLALFYLSAGFLGLAISMTTNNPLSQLVNNWFNVKTGTILGLVYAASGLGGTICDIIVGRIMNKTGFEKSLWITAAMVTSLLVIAMLILKETPQKMGLEPYGVKPSADGVKPQAKEPEGLTFNQARKTANFWLLIVMEILWGLAIVPVIANIPAHLTDNGLEALYISGTIMATLYAVSAASKFGMGIIFDKFGPVVMLVLIGVTTTVATFMLPGVTNNSSALVMCVIMGIGYACMTIPAPLIVTYVFGRKDYAAIIGPVTAMLTFAGAIGTPLSNLVFDKTGTYNLAFILQAIFFAAAAVCGILAVTIKIKKTE